MKSSVLGQKARPQYARMSPDKGLDLSFVGDALQYPRLQKSKLMSTMSPAEYEKVKTGRLAEVFVFSNFTRVPVEDVIAGDICAVTGLPDVSIGETICNTDDIIPLPSISVSLLRLEASYQIPQLALRMTASRPDVLVLPKSCRLCILVCKVLLLLGASLQSCPLSDVLLTGHKVTSLMSL